MENNKEEIIESYLKEMKEDEISLKKVAAIIGDYVAYIKKNAILVAVVSLVLAGLFFYKAIKTEPVYPAVLTFMVNEEESGGSAGVAGILGQFIGGGGGEFNLQKIVKLTLSRLIIETAIFEKKTVNGTNDYLANHIIDIYDMREDWQENEDYPELADFKYTHSNTDSFSLAENYVLKSLVSKVAGDVDNGVTGFLSADFDETTTILEYKTSTLSEELSVGLVEAVFENLADFYIDKATERQLATYEIVNQKVDSLERELNAKQYQLLKFQDSHKNLLLTTASSKKVRLTREIQILTYAFGKASENREVADFSLRSATPYFQVIDKPLRPISPSVANKILNAIIGFILGFVLISIILVAKKLYTDNSKKGENAD